MGQSEKGDRAEAFAEELLVQRGYAVRNLNHVRRNTVTVDLEVEGQGAPFYISVKSCWSPNRQLRLGTPTSLALLPDTAFVMAFLPCAKGEELDLAEGRHTLWIIPGNIARDEALAAHCHYAAYNPGSAHHSVMVKDKVDRTEATRSGSVFKRWAGKYDEAWHLLPEPFALPPSRQG